MLPVSSKLLCDKFKINSLKLIKDKQKMLTRNTKPACPKGDPVVTKTENTL